MYFYRLWEKSESRRVVSKKDDEITINRTNEDVVSRDMETKRTFRIKKMATISGLQNLFCLL